MLQVKYKNSDKRPLWLVDERYTIGSAAGSDIPIEDEGIAAQQAVLNVTPEKVLIDNLGPADMVSINGEALVQKAPLKHGDIVVIGPVVLEFVDPKLLRESEGAAKPAASASSVEQSSGWSLKALNTALANKQFPINREVTLGRSNDCDITLGVAHLSRRHAKLNLHGDQLEVEDLRSSNGTFINGKRVEKSLLKDGDELSFDTLSFRVSGPTDDSDSTMLRAPQADVNKTTIRPAIKVPGADPAPKSRPAAAKTHHKPTASKSPKQSTTMAEEKEGASTGLIVAAVVGLVIIVGAVLYFIG